MKHLKTYRLFESKEIVMAGVENAVKNKNYELLFDLFRQHDDMIDVNKLIDLIIKHSSVEQLSILPKRFLEKTTQLQVEGKVNNLDFLHLFPNLEKLRLFNNSLTSFNGIEHLTKLTIFRSSLNEISDLSPLSGLIKLKELGIIASGLENLQPLRSLVNLESLDVAENDIRTFKGIENLPNLKVIYLLENDNLPNDLNDMIWSVLDLERQDTEIMDKEVVDIVQNYYKDEAY